MNLTGTPNVAAGVEHEYWRANFYARPYVKATDPYEKFGPAYQFGWEQQARFAGKSFDAAEPSLVVAWASAKAKSGMKWEEAKPAVRDSFERAARQATKAA